MAEPWKPGTQVIAPPDVPAGVKADRDLVYARVGDSTLRLDLYRPENATGPLPLVVYIHGGGWRALSKEKFFGFGLVQRGFAVASINYRLTYVAPFPAQIHDAKAALRWLRAHADVYQLDAARFGVWGESAGGHLASLLGLSGHVTGDLDGNVGEHTEVSSAVHAVCAWYPPTDLLRMYEHRRVEPVSPSILEMLLGAAPPEVPELTRLASPMSHVTQHAPPFLIMHGDADTIVPIEQGMMMHEALCAAGVKTQFTRVPGVGHGTGAFLAHPQLVVQSEDFFVEHL